MSTDVWAQLMRATECCEVVIRSRHGPGAFLSWEVTIHPIGKPEKAISSRSVSVMDAVAQGLDMVRGMKWVEEC